MSRVASASAGPAEAVGILYEIRGPEEVWPFLDTHPFLVPLLTEAHGRIRTWFPASRVFLQVLDDPEDPANSQLVAFMATDLVSGAAFEQLQELDANWWFAAMDRAKGKFHINLEPA